MSNLSISPPPSIGQGRPIFLFTNIERSTPLWEKHRQTMLAAQLQHNAILEQQLPKHGGRILELRGDGVKAVFEGVDPLLVVTYEHGTIIGQNNINHPMCNFFVPERSWHPPLETEEKLHIAS